MSSQTLGAWALLKADLRLALAFNAEVQGQASESLLRRVSWMLTPCMLTATLHRVAHALWRRGWRWCAWRVAGANRWLNRIDIHPACAIGPGLYIPHPAGVSLRGHAQGELVVLSAAIAGGLALAGPQDWPRFGRDVWVGAAARVHGALEVGDHARIGPGVVLTSDLPARHAALAQAYRPQPREEPS